MICKEILFNSHGNKVRKMFIASLKLPLLIVVPSQFYLYIFFPYFISRISVTTTWFLLQSVTMALSCVVATREIFT